MLLNCSQLDQAQFPATDQLTRLVVPKLTALPAFIMPKAAAKRAPKATRRAKKGRSTPETRSHRRAGLIEFGLTRTTDPNAPKRGLSAYMFFANEQRENVREENPGITFGQVGKLLGERWKALNEKQRAPYEAKAAADKKRYEDEKQAYNVGAS